jgi:ketosteroid isomerase-like protein
MSMSVPGLMLLAVLGTLQSAPRQMPADDVRSLRQQSNAAIARHDVEAVVSFLDSDYQITVGSGGLFHGRAAELEAWRAEFARAADLVYVRTPESVEVSTSGERAAEIGVWVGSWTTLNGPHRLRGRYAAHWRKVGGSWKIRSELFVTLRCEGVGCS